MSSSRLGSRGLLLIQQELTERGVAIVRQVGELRLMTGKQIGVVHFPSDEHSSALAAARALLRSGR